MKKLKRSECAVLHLGLKHNWYRMIESGVKRGGCGASATGKTRRQAEKAWNRNPPDTPEEGAGK